MREARLTGLDSGQSEAFETSIARLVASDLRAPTNEYEEEAARTRATRLRNWIPAFIVVESVCWAPNVWLLATKEGASADVGFGLWTLTILAGMALLCWQLVTRKWPLQPRLLTALTCGWSLFACVTAALTLQQQNLGAVGTAAAISGLVVPLIFLWAVPVATIPIIIIGATAVGAHAGSWEIGLLIGFLASILGLQGMFDVKEHIRRAAEEWAIDRDTRKASRLVEEFEHSGKGWFWETGADGTISYMSAKLARDLGRETDDLLGKPFLTLLSDQDSDPDEKVQGERSLAFHLGARFSFTDLTVKADGHDDLWWSLSGRPIYDNYGRFCGYRGMGADLTEQRRAEAEISRLARYDTLTGLANRAVVRTTLEQALRSAPRRLQGCSLFLMDLDRFKNVNDTLGHPAGDLLLQQVAERLTNVAGDQAQIGRLGGDEFIAVFPGIESEAKLAEIARDFIKRISQPYIIQGVNVSIGTSIGIAIAPAGEACADALIRSADLALYAAKSKGRGTHVFYEPEMHAEAEDRRVLEHDLRHALADGALELLFQPVVSIATEDLTGFEALLRWNHPTKGYISPATFVPMAEECGLIDRIGEWVLRTACAEAAKRPPHIVVAVNLSPIQFNNPALIGTIMSALAESGLPARQLELEITEGVFLSDSPATDDVFARLKGVGVRLALDDFGTGYSSLGYLKKAPFDKIKIDQSFVRGAAISGSRNAAIIKAIVGLAEGLGMDTTAEGAETHDELELIRELGCSHVQGYLFGRAMPAEEALKLSSHIGAVCKDGYHFSREMRHGVIKNATLKWKDRDYPVRVRNISNGGALLDSRRGFAPGQLVWLQLQSAEPEEAEVRWSQNGKIGIRFAKDFDIGGLMPAQPALPSPGEMLTPDYIASEEFLRSAGSG